METIFDLPNDAKGKKMQKKGAWAAAADDLIDIREVLGVGARDESTVFIETFRDADDPIEGDRFGEASVIAADDIFRFTDIYDTVQNIFSAGTLKER